jgi:hypothetical protein
MLMSTVTRGETFTSLTSSGRAISGPEDYRQFHINWFSYPDWTIEFKLKEWHQGVEYGYYQTWYHYRQKNEKEVWQERESYFTLISTKKMEAGRWSMTRQPPIRTKK